MSGTERPQTTSERIAALHAGVVEATAAQGRRKGRGVYYTAAPVAAYMVDLVLGEVLREIRPAEGATGKILVSHLQSLQRLRVLDPACGSGAFLLAAFEALSREYRRTRDALRRLGGSPDVDPTRAPLHNLIGVDIDADAVEAARQSLWWTAGGAGPPPPPLDQNLVCGNALVDDASVDSRAVDWERTFPDVFAEGGFHVVLGNPPYVRQERIRRLKPFLARRYACHRGSADLYTYFVELGVRLLAEDGRLAYIVPNKWLRAGYGAGLRAFLTRETLVEQLVDFGHAPMFEGAQVFPCIVSLRRLAGGSDRGDLRVCPVPSDSEGELSEVVTRVRHRVPRARLGEGPWILETPAVLALLDKIRRCGATLADLAGGTPHYGVKTGLNAAFVVDADTRARLIAEEPRSAELFQPFLRGRDLDRWIPREATQTLIFSRRGTDLDRYPAIRRHLESFRARLEPRPPGWRSDAGDRWPGRKPGAYRWYEIQDAVDYHAVFERPKILTQDLATHPRFCLDRGGAYPSNTCYAWPTDDLYVLGWLCSPLAWWVMHRTLQRGLNDTLRMFTAQVARLPVAEPAPALRAEVEDVVGELLEAASPTASRGVVRRGPELEARLSQLICAAHGLDRVETALIWSTAPRRTPGLEHRASKEP